jgi:Tol biopolymer transport system component
VKGDDKEHLFIVRRTPTGWGAAQQLTAAGDNSNDNEPHLSPDGKTIYYSSDRSPKPTFPRTHAQALGDEQRLEAWDNGNSNVWSIAVPQAT